MSLNHIADTKEACQTQSTVESTEVCDFRNAFLHFELDFKKQPTITVTAEQPFTLNHVRIQLECRCLINGVEYVLGAACKTERVNVDRDVWMLPNADFNPIASSEHFMVIKHWDHRERQVPNAKAGGFQLRRQSGLAAEAWPSHRLDTPTVEAILVTDSQQAWEAVVNNRTIVSRTAFQTDDGLNVVLEYPIKTVNVSNRDDFCQCDTGPVLVPLPDPSADKMIDRLHLAYIAQRGADWAELIVNVPTPITEGLSVDHYSQSLRVEAKSALFVLD